MTRDYQSHNQIQIMSKHRSWPCFKVSTDIFSFCSTLFTSNACPSLPCKMSKKRSEKELLVDINEENCEDEFNEICDEVSDSEIEHISEASEDDDDELSCDTDNIPLTYLINGNRQSIVSGTSVRMKKRKLLNPRPKVVNIVRKKATVNRKIKRKRTSVKVGNTGNTKKLKINLPKGSYFVSKDETIWKKDPFPQTISSDEVDNSFEKLNIPDNVQVNTPMDFFNLFFTDEICDEILKCTNLAAMNFYDSNDDFKLVNKHELRAFFGLLISAGHLKSCNENYRSFWHPYYGSPIFPATMGVNRFEQLLRFIRFDNKSTRSERRKTDKLCPIRNIWEQVTANFKKYYIPSKNLTIDEQLMPCRCRCGFIQFMSKKPDKYGIKIFWICDCKTAYPLQGLVYTGKIGNKRTVDLARTVVETLCQSYHGTNRNITTDNYFTSYPLAKSLLSNGLNLIGTLKKNKTCVPLDFLPNRTKKEGSTMFGFQKDITLASHVPKVGKAVLFLSTIHHDNNVINEEGKKPISEINKHYNRTKGGVDTMDQMVHEYMTKRKTNRWPFAFFMNLLDVANIAAYTLWCKKFPLWNAKKGNKRNLFLRELGEKVYFAFSCIKC